MIKKAAGIYSIIIGISMIGQWAMFYFNNQIPELQTEPIRIAMHIIAEFLTAILLIIGGYGLYKNTIWGFNTYLIASGMLLYTIIVSPGYFAQLGQYEFVVMFGLLIIFTIGLLVGVLKLEKAK